jgi:FKBP-type peptidyl-prolyl cis-trans isomerase
VKGTTGALAIRLFAKRLVAIVGALLLPHLTMRNFVILLLLGAGLLTLALVVRSGIFARNLNSDEPINSSMRLALAEESPQVTTYEADLIRQKYPTAYRMPSGLWYINTAPGTDHAKPQVSQTVTVTYEARLLDGTPFDSSAQHPGPFSFVVGVGKAPIKGLDEAFLTMRKGGRRKLIIPYWLAFGDAGFPPLVPARATVVYDVELVDFH